MKSLPRARGRSLCAGTVADDGSEAGALGAVEVVWVMAFPGRGDESGPDGWMGAEVYRQPRLARARGRVPGATVVHNQVLGNARRTLDTSRVKRGWGLIATLALLAAFPAAGSTLYRCVSGDGIPQYVSKRVSGATCRAVGNAPPPPRRGAATPAARPVATPGAAPANVDNGAPATFMGGASVPASAASAPSAATPASTAAAPPAAARTQPASGQRRLQQGRVYSYVKDGIRHYSSRRPAGGADVAAVRTINYSFFETCYACGAAPGVNFGNVRLNNDAYRDEVARAASDFGVDVAIVRAIMHAESAFNPNALSRAGAQGLMQLMPATAARFGVVNAFDPEQNIRGGVEYLAWLLKRFNGDLTLAAAGYNAGEGAVQRHGGVPPYAETQRYVVRVGTLADRYRGQLASR